ncbi:MAG: heat-inducible transcription repressor HrcA, partial [Candidatus Cloacimonetes bacterium]|nr:heat-inducible transcription repressor HrcA [Candidatus Cloacimonadota bacterium]
MKKNEIRQAEVLKYLVEEYIESIEPVSSKLICEKYVKDSSPATIRIDLNKLEKENYIYQPHTSAGRIPTILGYRHYLKQIGNTLDEKEYTESRILQEILIKHYKDIPRALHYIMQLLAKETEQLSFVAEPEISYGHLDKLDVFKIAENKLLFVVSLDSGLDKTVILKTDYHISEQQLKALVRYVNEEFVGHRIYDIQNRYIIETTQKVSNDNKLLKLFLDELHAAFARISSFYIHFDGSISFLEQPEFDDKSSILKFLGFIQRQEYLVNLMQRFDTNEQYHVLL